MIIDQLLEKNQEFLRNFKGEDPGKRPAKKLAIVTCMDTRLTDFLEPAMGLERGDAKIIKNAGNTITDDALRSLVVAVHSLGVEEIMVMGILTAEWQMLTLKDSGKPWKRRESPVILLRNLDWRTGSLQLG